MKKRLKSILPHQCRPACASCFRSKAVSSIAAAILCALTVSGCAGTASSSDTSWKGALNKQFVDVPYTAKANSKYQNLDIYLPKSPEGARVPLVVFIHGGGWYEGDKGSLHVLNLLKDGFAVASINYRLTDEAHFPAQIEDVKAAIRFLRANAGTYGFDPDRIGAWGMSAGGHLAALAGTAGDAKELEGQDGPQEVSSRVQAVVDWFGPSDFTGFSSGTEKLDKNVDWMVDRFFGGKVTEHAGEAKAASPVTYVSADDPPFLIMHGTIDTVVPLSQSERLDQALRKAGGKVKLVVVKDQGHVLFPQPYFEEVTRFFEENLKAKKATSSLPATQSQTP